MHGRIVASFIVLCGFLLTGCGRAPTVSEIAGRYLLNHDGVQDVLILNADKTYNHTFYFAGVRKAQSSKWEYDSIDTDDTFAPCTRIILSDYEDGKVTGYWPACVEKSYGGHIAIPVDVDLGINFEKQ